MKLLIVLSVCLVLASAMEEPKRSRGAGAYSKQKPTTPNPHEMYDEDLEDCSYPWIDVRTSAKIDKWACVCRQNNLARDTCEEEIRTLLQDTPNLKLCSDTHQFYLANKLCRDEQQFEQSDDAPNKAMQFAFDLFRSADPHSPNENFIISPLSPQVLLAQLIEGCSESARKEMIKALKLNSRETSKLVENLMASANKDSNANKLDIASIIFRSKDMNISDNFNSARKDSKIPLKELDFSNTHQAAQTVNQWASEKTRGNIQEVVTEQSLSPDMSLLLLNAIYFKGTWQYKFQQNQTNKRAKFETAPNTDMPVHMMAQTNRLRFGEINFGYYSDVDEGLRWVELPYNGDQLSMIFLLPKTRHELDKMLSKVNGSHLMEIFTVIKRDYNPIKIHLKVPRFTIKNSISLVEPLKKLGVKQIFEEDDALSALSNTPARVGDVKQDAYLSVDEAGTTATAVSKITIIPLSLNSYEDMDFVCDEPFMVMVVDKTNQIPLFMAKIKQPLKSKQNNKQRDPQNFHRRG